MIIDMHTHCFPDPLAEKAMPMLALRSGNPAPPSTARLRG